jgi:PEP-CTERM motif-containing protein
MNRRVVLSGLLVLTFSGLPVSAGAVPIALTLDTTQASVFQQTLNNPCVIGNPSCNNPADFGFTLLPVSPTSPQVTVSPTYTVDQIRTLLGGISTFFIGIDISQAPGQGPYGLNSFTVNVGGSDAFQYTGPTDLTSSGNGFSDALLRTVDLSAFAGSANVIFTVNFSNDNGAREQFFVVSSQEPPAAVPEPTTLLLLGSTMAGLGFLQRRRARRDP